jgi:hypothetical protein
MLKVMPPDGELIAELNDGGSPALLKFGDHYSYLVMPLTA